MQNSDELRLSAPSLPKGGGALTGLSGTPGNAGPDGAASLTLPLPVSAGRGYAPALAIQYSSQAGNGPFGMGWALNLSRISRRTRLGVPGYQDSDEFIGSDGEVLVVRHRPDGEVDRETRNALLGTPLGSDFTVTAFRSRVEQDFSLFEFWSSPDERERDFWVQYSPDGQVFLLGKNPQARLFNPDNQAQTAQWLLESSVSIKGEQCYYLYREENDEGCDASELAAHATSPAQRYLTAVYYGNRVAGRTLPGLTQDATPATDWLFCLVLDYGERSTSLKDIPAFASTGDWLCRQDRFSRYEYGFDLRTRRLCRQVMMYHYLDALAGKTQPEETPALVGRLLLEYDEQPSVSLLTAVRQVAYEPDTPQQLRTLPPLEFGWQTFTPPAQPAWQQRDDLHNLNGQQPYQLLDLHGEGLAGVLYQDVGAWWYRAPVRQANSHDDNAITWSAAQPLPSIPSLRNGAMLTDLNGDGRLQWVVTEGGVGGSYDQNAQGRWQHFVPLQTLPQEYAHPQAKLADIMGGGFADLVMIGPRSVRLYAGIEGGWKAGETVLQAAGVVLPMPDAHAQVLVAFSDLLGSGQQHLVHIGADGVTCWPNLGQGRFGLPLSIQGFSQPVITFNPQQVYLADIDGSGTADLIYAHADRLDIYLNQSGNRFAAPFSVALPDGVQYDRTCQLRVADIQGLGVASLLLTLPHPTPRHWLCHLTTLKPWLLNITNNNMGAQHCLHYRSSAQFWLDEKAHSPSQTSYLPLPLHLLWRNELEDEITGNHLMSEVRYRHGAWDSQEREFRGFGYLEVQDTLLTGSQGTGDVLTQPALTRSWFATGLPEIDNLMPAEYWPGDTQAFSGFTPLFTHGEGLEESVYEPEPNTVFWLKRALKGQLLRSEIYGLDNHEWDAVPYSVSENRPQVRIIEANGTSTVVCPSIIESRNTVYERISSDPQCSQHIVLTRDKYGQPLRQVTIHYPRRTKPVSTPYPDTLPETLFPSSYDDQQTLLRLMLEQHRWHHLIDTAEGIRVLGLPDAQRGDAFTHPADSVPLTGLTQENIENLLTEGQPAVYIGQQQITYLDRQNLPTQTAPTPQALLAFTDTAVLDEIMSGELPPEITEQRLLNSGYQRADYLFPQAGEMQLWIMRQGHMEYASADHFWRPLTVRTTLLTGSNTLFWDTHDCVMVGYRDAAGLTTAAVYDYRFLTPIQVTDPNDNISSVTLDALGRVTTSRFWGVESGKDSGYSQTLITPPDNIVSALALTAPLPLASCQVYVADSWMPEISQAQLTQVGLTYTDAFAIGILTEDGRLCALSSGRFGCEQGRTLKAHALRQPPHGLALTTDSYDKDPQQQISQQVTFSDGFGRILQTAIRQVPGDAWQYSDNGSLVTDEARGLLTVHSDFRWAVTGRTEYDNKGQPVRTYQPYFLNDWRYVSDDSARQDLFADTHYYDSVGRVYQVTTAKGWLIRTLITPWFMVQEDENDTLRDENKH
ncbi:SpvB/TcaC N-terminal domain-containing protein [Yersinia kristensenii]|uniref:SpvB/TcaC N-terminal domain-containing protein n=1 Tax=Yersinia kristensenii TaxID=28152 RepID=UPI0005E9E66C|nr:SpvB/TcaC N-terminal domain-containing protein [Yersinia kristensenii]CNF36018.1 insecticidal toxin complex protein [Yersinia kristensenii]